ncbi:hypothetical protein BB8028_0005g06660 [Beauveria bassiana]|uniref:Zn(2)-C6 fungal-type domain-containing protein n=1 Tax=Beauveria bassiana TaxID=176275 RepID=A0A2S7YH08_BEABA|nr:hypothetical protein BB8028_0005g06660 [Beauveria bassiana]
MPKRTQTNRPQPNAQRRRRVYAACSECRRRRRKCDGSQPCAQCQAYGYACLYDAENFSSPAQSSSDAAATAAAAAAHPRQPLPLQTRQRGDRGGGGGQDATPTAPQQPPPPSALLISRERGRFISAHSAVALPLLVGQELAITQPPLRLHSYAWNLGIRPERRGTPSPSSLADYFSLAECQTLCAVYFSAVHPLFAFLHPETFTRRLARGWSGDGGGGGGGGGGAAGGAAGGATVGGAAVTTTLDTGQPNFAAVVALVAVLGSVFSPTPHPREQDIKRHALAILDRGLSTPVAPVDMDTVAGWILRALYMRLTTRPAISAMATHAAMHMAEMIGLHREMHDPGSSSATAAAASTSTSTSKVSSTSSFSDEELETRRRCFCVARFLNLLLTTEYGLSAVSPRHATCLAPARVPGAHIDALYTMSSVLHDAEAAAAAAAAYTRASSLDSDEFADLFLRLRDMPRDDDLVALFAGDVCLCLLRRFSAASLSSGKPSPRIVGASVAVLRRALDAVAALLAAGRTWWNMLSVPFQSVCVCVLVDGVALLELLPAAMELLRGMADRFESHMAREALATAQQVIAASRGRTDAKLAIKDAALSHALPVVDIDWASFDTGFDLGHVWPPVMDFFG